MLRWSVAFVLTIARLIALGQSPVEASFSNEALMQGKTGKQYELLTEKDGEQLVLVKWKHGYVAYGVLRNEKPEGYWYLYDGRGRVRNRLFFSSGILAMAESIDKHGNRTARTGFAIPW